MVLLALGLPLVVLASGTTLRAGQPPEAVHTAVTRRVAGAGADIECNHATTLTRGLRPVIGVGRGGQ